LSGRRRATKYGISINTTDKNTAIAIKTRIGK